MMNDQLLRKINLNIIKDQQSDCWLWNGQISNSGYGKVMIKDKDTGTRYEGAKEVSYMAYIGEIPQGHGVTTKCSNRLCVNPQHLELIKTQCPDAY